jgi:ABC-type phosphate transport system substrate-binding protein
MKLTFKLVRNSRSLGFLFIVLFFASSAFCGTTANDALFDLPPFADPSETVEMDQEWLERNLKHPDDVGADLYAVLSHQMFDLWDPWIDEFARKKKITIHTQYGVDGTSAGSLRRKEADVACYCGSPKSSDRMPGVTFHTAGVVPVVFFVNASNPVDDVNLDAAMKVFRGEINNWMEIGGEIMSIMPVARSHCKKRLGRWRPLNNMDNLSPSAIKVGSIEDALEYVASTPGSIGYEILSRVEPYVRSGQVKVLTVNGMNPFNLEFLSQGKYPLYRAYTFTTWQGVGLENPLAGELVNMLLDKTSEKASDIFFVPAEDLRKSGWLFHGKELIGEPQFTDPS